MYTTNDPKEVEHMLNLRTGTTPEQRVKMHEDAARRMDWERKLDVATTRTYINGLIQGVVVGILIGMGIQSLFN